MLSNERDKNEREARRKVIQKGRKGRKQGMITKVGDEHADLWPTSKKKMLPDEKDNNKREKKGKEVHRERKKGEKRENH